MNIIKKVIASFRTRKSPNQSDLKKPIVNSQEFQNKKSNDNSTCPNCGGSNLIGGGGTNSSDTGSGWGGWWIECQDCGWKDWEYY